jgi:hypothetical protein
MIERGLTEVHEPPDAVRDSAPMYHMRVPAALQVVEQCFRYQGRD